MRDDGEVAHPPICDKMAICMHRVRTFVLAFSTVSYGRVPVVLFNSPRGRKAVMKKDEFFLHVYRNSTTPVGDYQYVNWRSPSYVITNHLSTYDIRHMLNYQHNERSKYCSSVAFMQRKLRPMYGTTYGMTCITHRYQRFE